MRRRNPTSGPSKRNLKKAKTNSVVQGDFTASTRLIWLSALAIPIGVACGLVAVVLQRLIGLFTNIFYFHTFSVPNELLVASAQPSRSVGDPGAGRWRT